MKYAPGFWAWFKKGSGTFVRSTLRAVPAKVPDPFLNHARFLVGIACLLAFFGLTCAPVDDSARPGKGKQTQEDASPSVIFSPAAGLKERVAAAIDHVRSRELLTTHGFWTIFHGLLGLGLDTQLVEEKTNKRVRAIDVIAQGGKIPDGGKMRGLDIRPTADGLDVISATPGDWTQEHVYQGHQDQFVAEMSQWNISPKTKFHIRGKDYTFLDFARHSKMRASIKADPAQELSWAIIMIAQFFGTDVAWTNANDEKLTFDDVVRYEVRAPIEKGSACGGTHRLFGLTWAYHLHLSKGGKKTGVWLEVADTIDKFKKRARETQNADGSFSVNYFTDKAPGKRDNQEGRDRRIGTTGHILEWLALALTQQELQEPWVQEAVRALVGDIMDSPPTAAVDGGGLYHATHGLQIYYFRLFGPLPGQMPPMVP